MDTSFDIGPLDNQIPGIILNLWDETDDMYPTWGGGIFLILGYLMREMSLLSLKLICLLLVSLQDFSD